MLQWLTPPICNGDVKLHSSQFLCVYKLASAFEFSTVSNIDQTFNSSLLASFSQALYIHNSTMASLSRNTFLSDAHAIDLCFDLDDALTLPQNEEAGYQTGSRTSSESDRVSHDDLVANLPTVAAVEGVICSVCVEGFRAEEKRGGRGKQVPCGHVYHETCISKWLSHSNSCPLCRSTIFDPHQ